MNLALIGTPALVGGAATKIADLIELLHPEVRIDIVCRDRKVIPKVEAFIRERKLQGIQVIRIGAVCRSRHDVALGICDAGFFESEVPGHLRKQKIPLVWSNDMMWEFQGERRAAKEGLIDRVILVSDFQRAAFSECYQNIDSRLIPNYVSPRHFPFSERDNSVFTIGRLSRADPAKYPVDFPVFYEELELSPIRYKVQAWSDELKRKYAWHSFNPEWEFFSAGAIPSGKFLSCLDLFVYPLGHEVKESWGRSTVEAMLTGCVVLVPKGHNFENMMIHGDSGFVCSSFSEFKAVAKELFANNSLRMQVGRKAAEFARGVLCNEKEHRKMWIEALTF